MAHRDRDFLAAEVMAEAVEAERFDGPVLVMGEPTGVLAGKLDVPVERWERRAGSGVTPSPFPPSGPFAAVLLRTSKSSEELVFNVALAAAALAPGSPLYLFGANDEGIRSAGKVFAPFFDAPDTLLTKRHCRVFRGMRNETAALPSPDEFLKTIRAETASHELSWVSWPGMFAHGKLDKGSELLLENLPPLASGARAGARVLDFGCGAGVLSLALQNQTLDLDITLFDNDALALHAAERNVEGAETCCGTSLADLEGETFDLIVSNPPVHTGKAQTYTILERLIEMAPQHLGKGGRLRMVVQGTTPVRRMLEASFKTVALVAENRSYAVWDGVI